jgi:hypothetical protein
MKISEFRAAQMRSNALDRIKAKAACPREVGEHFPQA